MRFWNRPDDDLKAEHVLSRHAGLQRELQVAAADGSLFRHLLSLDPAEEMRPAGQWELLFEALAALEARVSAIEEQLRA